MSNEKKECCEETVSCASVNDIIESVALEQTSISHILNTEGEKMQKMLAGNPSIDEMLCMNKSVANTIENVTSLEIVLLGKLKAVVNLPCGSCPAEKCSFTLFTYICQTGVALPAVEVKICNAKMQLIDVGTTNESGIYFIGGLDCGTYHVVLKDPSCGEVRAFDINLNAVQCAVSRAECFKRECVGCQILVTATDCDCHEPLACIKIKIKNLAGAVVCFGETDTDGKFLASGLPAGEYVVEATDEVCQITKKCEVKVCKESPCATVNFCFQRRKWKEITITGMVCNGCQQPLENCEVRAFGVDSKSTCTDCCGKYTIKCLKVCDKLTTVALCNGKTSPMHTIKDVTESYYTINFVIK